MVRRGGLELAERRRSAPRRLFSLFSLRRNASYIALRHALSAGGPLAIRRELG